MQLVQTADELAAAFDSGGTVKADGASFISR
jgi:hypothetical protein